jgi:hypothetical protein
MKRIGVFVCWLVISTAQQPLAAIQEASQAIRELESASKSNLQKSDDEVRLIQIGQANASLMENLQKPTEVRIDVVDELGVVVVRGPKQDVIRVESAIKKLLRPETETRETDRNDASPELARAVTVDDFRTASKSLDLQLNSKVRISFLDKMGLILIQGNREDVIIVEKAINDFIESTKARGPVNKLIRLKNAQSKNTAELITQIYEEQYQDREGKVSITPLNYPESLLVVGKPGAIEVVQELAEAFDVDWIK